MMSSLFLRLAHCYEGIKSLPGKFSCCETVGVSQKWTLVYLIVFGRIVCIFLAITVFTSTKCKWLSSCVTSHKLPLTLSPKPPVRAVPLISSFLILSMLLTYLNVLVFFNRNKFKDDQLPGTDCVQPWQFHCAPNVG